MPPTHTVGFILHVPAPLTRVLLGVALISLLPACAVRQALLNRVDDSIAGTGAVYASDPDVELVGAAAPFGLKLIESLLAELPAASWAAARGLTWLYAIRLRLC